MARKELGYTQKSLSEKTEVNKITISEIENGRFIGSFDIFERVLDGVGLEFEVNKKSLTCRIGMKLKQYLQKMMNEIIQKLLSFGIYIQQHRHNSCIHTSRAVLQIEMINS